MTQEKTTPHNIPKLRFPEFRDGKGWEKKMLGKVYSFKVTNSFPRDKLNYEKGWVKNIHYGDIHTKFSTLFDIKKEIVPFVNPSEAIEKIKLDRYCIEGDMVFADASEDLNDVGKSIEIVNLNNEKLLSGLHTLLARQKRSELVIGFGGYLFKSNNIRTGIKKEAQGAKVLGVSAGRLSNIHICFPTDKKEQQKIAGCLSSIDELIDAQAQKLDTLRAHKKGLMQQFFPAKAETVPKLRFPEFRDAGAWEEKKLKEISVINQGLQIPISKRFTEKVKNSYFYITNEFLKENSNKVYYIKNPSESVICDEVDILMTRTGNTGQVVTNVRGVFHNNFFKIKYTNEIDKGFFVYFLRSENLQNTILKLAGSSTIPDLNHSDFYRIEIKLPSLVEQQKITNCLSSIDELITAQAQKLDTLKVHKKGLMQQLFPLADEVNG